MPFLPNGRPLDIVLNPLGVPSRMNIGQVLEIHLSLAANVLGFKVSTPIFDGANEKDIMDTLEMANDYVNTPLKEFEKKYKDILDPEVMEFLLTNQEYRKEWEGVPINRDGKVRLRDGRTGEYFDGAVTIGFMHYLKLHHLVDDKIHARSTGPYSLVTQQPLGVTGRVKTYEAIIKGENISEPGIPESFKVLLKELQSLALDVTVLDENGEEVLMTENIEYGDTELTPLIEGDDNFRYDDGYEDAGYREVNVEDGEMFDTYEDLDEEEDDDEESLDFRDVDVDEEFDE